MLLSSSLPALRKFKPWAPRRDLRLLDPQGVPAASDFDERTIVKKHFQGKLEAADYTFGGMIDDDRAECASRAPELAAVEKSLVAIPSLTAVVHRHAHAKYNGMGKVPLGGEVKRLLPRTIAAMVHPLHVKAAIFIRLPVHWLGGCIQELWKGKGSRSLIAQYRDITLADLDGKVFGAFVRASIIVAV